MSIGNMPEDELDDLFRQAASGYNPEFDPKAWQAMEQKLDARPKVATTNHWKLTGLTILLLLTAVSVWVGYNQLNQKQETVETSVKEERGITNKVKSEETESTFVPDPRKENKKENSSTASAAATSPAKVKPGPDVNKPATTIKNAPGFTSKAPKTKSVNQKGFALNQPGQQRQKNAGVILNPNPDNIAGKDINPDEAVVTKTLVKTEIAATENKSEARPIAADSVVNQPDSPATDLLTNSNETGRTTPLPDSAAVKKDNSLFALNRFTFSVMAAPDLSTVDFANPGGISTNAGLAISYNLNKKWSLATGIVKARKIYDAKAEDYGDDYYWYNKHKPDAISAVCQVLDIPINIGYNLWQKEKSVFTVQTGLSSYLMLNEEYAYEYLPYGGGNGYTSYYEFKNKNQHIFSIYNLSGRYGRQLTPGLMAGVEPFVKVPLAGVGAGKVKLASAGVFFSLSYRYPK